MERRPRNGARSRRQSPVYCLYYVAPLQKPALGTRRRQVSHGGNYSLVSHGEEEEVVHNRTSEHFNTDDMCSNRSNGGGGFGNPLEKDPRLVREDVLDGYVSIAGSREDYGVVIDPQTLESDREKTESLRRGKHLPE